MKFSTKQIIVIIIVIVIVLFVVLAIAIGRKPIVQKEITLTIWGVNDSQEVLKSVFEDFQKKYPKIKIEYTKFDEADYETSLINALAANKGPDIFMFHRSWLGKHKDKILAFDKTKISLTKLRELFPSVIEQDFSDGQNIYALPLYIDTLATIYNKDIFDATAIAIPPTTWQEFKILIPRLRKIDPKTSAILRAAGAIGGSKTSIHNASEILNLIMMQANLSFPKNASEQLSFPLESEELLSFYVEFANPKSLVYTWNDGFSQGSLETFSNEEVAIIFDYQDNLKILKKKNPYLDIGVSSMLQFDLDKPINFANYWGLVISNKSKNPAAAQSFILNLALNETNSRKYSQLSGRPPALRKLISQYQDDPNLGVFANQALSAKSWYQQDYNFINQVFSDTIKSVLVGKLSIRDALETAENKINSLIQ